VADDIVMTSHLSG